ncbi:MAG: FKBP-type peptidyl-prolyl cis-trans isomerase [Flavobacteriales bacterium]|nr:FKBP-type peptidyl-prolyl cis-trans isomerase [Flavobacteriales bacterium]
MNEPVIDLENESQKISYALGVSIAGNLKKQNFDSIDVTALTKAFSDSYEGGTMLMTEEDANNALNTYLQTLQQKELGAHLESGRAWLETNKTKEGVVTLASGLQYKELVAGSGESPAATESVTVHYHGTLIDGTVFDSSVDRGEPATFPVNGVIAGWIEALQLMKVGTKWELYIPTELAYGANPRPGGVIKANMALIFSVELLSINK